jgi:hypothetical protein
MTDLTVAVYTYVTDDDLKHLHIDLLYIISR